MEVIRTHCVNRSMWAMLAVLLSVAGVWLATGKFTSSLSVAQTASAAVLLQVENNPPSFPETESGQRSIEENTVAGIEIGVPVAAEDPDTENLTYSLGGVDAEFFDINLSTGQLLTKAALDHEAVDSHEVTVTASDGITEASLTVNIAVTNVDEPGIITLTPDQLRVGQVVRAHISDPDRRVQVITSVWQYSLDDGATWLHYYGLKNQNSAVLGESQEGAIVKVMFNYKDREGDGKQAEAISGSVAPAEAGLQVAVSDFVTGLSIPWDLAFAPDGTLLFTQRAGILSARLPDGTVQTVSADLTDLYVDRNTGFMGIVIDPAFSINRRFYTCQGHTGNELQIIAWTIDSSYGTAVRVANPLVGGIPTNYDHSGCRLRFGPDGYLWIATGDASVGTSAQNLDSLAGKILRVDAVTGAAPPSNPFFPSLIYTYGHRNPQGLAWRPGTSQMWSIEHGPYEDDEINLLVSGGNYGWDPDYDPETNFYYNHRSPMTDLFKFPDAIVAKWSSGSETIAPSGGIFLEGSIWGQWEGRFAVATLKGKALYLMDFTNNTLASEIVVAEVAGQHGRLRSLIMGPDQALYVTTSNGSGIDRILRITPQQVPAFSSDSIVVELPANVAVDTTVLEVEADDFNDDQLSYTIEGSDASLFSIADSRAGRVRVAAGLEEERVYVIDVIASDPAGLSDSIQIFVMTTAPVDPAVQVSFGRSAYSVSEGSSVSVTVELDTAPGRTVIIPIRAIGQDGASPNTDWSGVPQQITFGASETSKTFFLYGESDTVADTGESVLLEFGFLPEGISSGAIDAATVSILDIQKPITNRPIITGGGGGGGGGGSAQPAPEEADASEPEDDPEELAKQADTKFDDVEADAYYAPAVGWMLKHDITKGCGEVEFCPNQSVSRRQFVTFLWRAAGSPEPTKKGSEVFEDVASNSYANGAIGWAAEEGITVGCRPATDENLAAFCPSEPVSRAQVAAFLYRYVDAEAPTTIPDFEDVAEDAYYASPVAWMATHGITTGCAEDAFCPHQTATRAHAATFIYRVATTPESWGDEDKGILR